VTDLYAILGVAKTASKAAIKSAYRKLAKAFHPDKPNGNAEKFDEATKAYDVLSDDVKRARYDQTGETEEPEDPITPQAISMLLSVVGSIMGEPDILYHDPIPFFRSSLEEMKSNAIKAGAEARKKADHLIKVRARFKLKTPGERDIIGAFIDQNVDTFLRTKAAMDEQLVVVDAARSMLDAYTYDPEKLKDGEAPPSPKVSRALAEAMRSGKVSIDDILSGKF
jgi:curved DNA-binding protein CbpA